MAKLYFRYGAMGSSKTANAIMVQYNYRERGQNALMLKPRLDDRDGARLVGSRSGLSARCYFVEELDAIDLTKYNCVIVDEAQFMTKAQVEKLVRVVDEWDIPVICYGLRADFQGNLFEGSKWLLAWADTIEELKTVCWCGRKATCNTRVIDGKVAREGAQIMLGGSESYVALCRRHWQRGELAPSEIRRIAAGKKDFLELLLDADPEEQAIDRYLEDGDMYVLTKSGRVVSEIVLWPRPDGYIEIKNLATAADSRGQGNARRLVEYVKTIYAPLYEKMYVGTSAGNVSFYEHLGFVRAYTAKNFFVDNYENAVIDESGQPLVDMEYLVLTL